MLFDYPEDGILEAMHQKAVDQKTLHYKLVNQDLLHCKTVDQKTLQCEAEAVHRLAETMGC